GCAAGIANSRTDDSRRIQLLAGGRYVRPRASDESNSTDVDAFRNFSRQPESYIRIDVLPGPGATAGIRPDRFRSSLFRSLAQRGFHVRRYLLDAARLGSPEMGAAGRIPGCHPARYFQLLGEQLLWRDDGGNRRRSCSGCPAADPAAPAW